MDWFKVIFVMVAFNRLDSIQSETNMADELSLTIDATERTSSTTPPLCTTTASGCRKGADLILNLKSLEPPTIISKIETRDTDYCYQFTNISDSFIVHVNESHFNELSDCGYDLLSEFGKPLHYINGSSLSNIHTECPAEEKICLETIDNKCPLSNLTVRSDLDSDRKYINLILSWDKTDKNGSITGSIHHKKGTKENCLEEMPILINHSLLNNTILKPTYRTTPEVNPGCTYDIFLNIEHSEGPTMTCTYTGTYTVPDCVGHICDCEKYNTTPKILKVDHISDDRFLVTWDRETSTVNNKSYYYEDVHFKYAQSNKFEECTKKDIKKHACEIKMELLEGKEYELIGTFWNNFSCDAKDRYYFTVPKRSNYTVFILTVVLITLIIIFSALQYKNIPKYKSKFLNFVSPGRSRRNQHLQELISIQTGQIPMNSNIQYTPVEFLEGVFDEYEFPRNKVIIKEVIGSGAFGQVYSAKAIGIGGMEGYRIVAVKTLGEGENITKEATTDFIAEIEIFKKIGHHPNIVAFLGCCTVDAPYMMIMEFVPCGDLKNYLVDLRAQWLKKKNIVNTKKQFFFPDDSDGAYIEPPSPTSPVSITSSRLPSTSETVTTTLEDLTTPLLGPYTLDKVLDHTELQNFAFQIAKGMGHLENIGVTHRDLAARNILINEYKTLKISDFGLSRTGPYINHRTKKLPLRWMAIEAIVEQKYDSKSDVWSFGVVLWEIGTLGAFPYESVPDSFIQQFLQLGRRLERPEICTDDLYSVMKQCWATDPEKRPTFQDLVDALDVKKRKIYVNFNQLNPTYVFPPSDIEKCVGNPVQTIDINMTNG